TRQVHDTFTSYGRVDIFRPYFNVVPKQVRSRLIQSLIPRKPSKMSVATDLYGPLMIILTLVALLLLSMKSSGFVVKDGTLMGTALLTCFGAWIVISLIISTVSYILSTDVTSSFAICFTKFFKGYSLFGHCIVIFLTTLFHSLHTHFLFYVLVLIFCVPSAARVSLFLCSKTRDNMHKLALMIVITILHIGFICYLHFGFHTIVEGTFVVKETIIEAFCFDV
uniref:Protein YIPF3 n=1 Tax=Syphacia muris TaxID=451379 RepID=A0A0N5AUD4_9BILA